MEYDWKQELRQKLEGAKGLVRRSAAFTAMFGAYAGANAASANYNFAVGNDVLSYANLAGAGLAAFGAGYSALAYWIRKKEQARLEEQLAQAEHC